MACAELALTAALLGTAFRAEAASLAPDRELASVGDLVRIDMQHDIGLALPIGGLKFTYRIPTNAAYVANSVVVNGGAVADGGSVAVTPDSVRVSILLPRTGLNTVSLTVRAKGAIGEALVHRGSIGTALGSGTPVFGPATWIEDENARLYVCTLTADGFISQNEPGFNFGGASLVESRNGAERRPLFSFDLAGIPILGSNDVVQAARLELWPTVSAGAAVTLSAHRSKVKWTEGTQSGATCVGGATWMTRNCFNSWPAGGDYESVPTGSATVDAATRFTAIDVRSVVAAWIDGSRTNYGLEVVSSSTSANRSLTLPARENTSGATPAARLVVVIADQNAYSTPAVGQALAEIMPTTVFAGVPSQRFVYTFLPTPSGGTGIDRFTITIPVGFALVSLDSVTVNGAALNRNTDAVLAPGEFENWGTPPLLDVRFAPVLAVKQRVQAVFRATVPSAADPAREFLSLVDQDRRGYPAQSTTRGDANGNSGDSNTWSVTTIPGSVTLVQVLPADTTVAAGLTVPYRAYATFSTGSTVEVTASAQWSVTPDSLGAFNGAAGVMSALRQGTGAVHAIFGGRSSAPASVLVGPPVLQSIAVTPPNANVAAGIVAGFGVTAAYSDGSFATVTSAAVWSVSDSLVAHVVAPGQVRGLTVGSTKVFAAYGGYTETAVLDVTPAQLISIRVSPADTTVALGQAAPLHALGLYSDGSTSEVTSIARWVALPAGIVDIDANGLATGLGEGVASVTAAVGTVQSGAARFAVGPAQLLSLAIAPPDTTVAQGFDVQYHAQGTFSDGTTRDVSAEATWNAVPAGIAILDGTGLAHTTGVGSTAVTAVLDTISSGAATLTVGPAVVVLLDGAPDHATVPLGTPHLVTSSAHYSDGSVVDVTATAAWQSLDPAVADFTAPGQVATSAAGSARFVHSFARAWGDTLRLDVTSASLDSVAVTPGAFAAPPGVERNLTATAYFSDGATPDVTVQATWSSDAAGVADVSSLGVVSTLGTGTARITATVLGVSSAPCVVDVDPSAVTSLAVSPADTTVSAGQGVQYTARGSVGTDVYDLTALATWSSGDPAIAGIGSNGAATALSAGTTGIHAQYAALTADANLNVAPASVVGLDVLPALSTLRLGGTKTMSARATYSNGATADVTAQAAWSSTAPAVVFVEPGGLARALALGTAGIGATYAGATATDATLQVLPAVQAEALTTGTETVTPGAAKRLLLALRLTNRYLDVRRVTAVRVAVDGPASQMHFHADDGDGVFEPVNDTILAEGAPSGGTWSATGLALDLSVGTSRVFFVSADVSAATAPHGATVNAYVPDVTDFFWQSTTAVVPIGTFPLDSPGELRVRDLALAQLSFTPGVDSVLTAGRVAIPLFELHVPADGSWADALDHIELVQQGTAREVLDLLGLRLQSAAGGWHDAANFVPSGGGRWVATGMDLPIPPGGQATRIVADIATAAASNRTVQIQLPALALGFASGRRGPVDGTWAEPAAHRIDAPALLQVQGVDVATGGLIARNAQHVPVFGLTLTVRGVPVDTLYAVHFDNLTTNAAGAPLDPNAEIAAAELWIDTNADGAAGAGDTRLETLTPPSGNTLQFGAAAPWAVPLTANQPIRLLMTLSPDSVQVRDDERLSVRFASATTGRMLVNDPQAPLEPALPPVVDGQGAAGYQVRRIPHTLVTGGTQNVVVLDFVLPANGFVDDELNRIRITNTGSADAGDVASLRLVADDGNGTLGPEDVAAAALAPIASRTWEASGLAVGLPSGAPQRYYVVLDVAPGAAPGRTFEAQAGLGDLEVASGNDGPNDHPLDGGGPVVFTVRDQVLWVAGVAGSHAVPADAVQQAALVLETLNAYDSPRTLQALRVTVRGTAAAFEYDRWELVADVNENGGVDPDETPLALGTMAGDVVLFEGFQYVLEPLRQQRLLVTYSLAPGLARDGSIIDATVVASADFGYAENGATVTAAEFEMNSAGQDEVDGMTARQVGNGSVVPQTLGGAETNVLALDLTLPANGWSPDVLNSLAVVLQTGANPARFGPDVEAIRLWRETDAAFQDGRFDASQDVLLQSLQPGAPNLRFDALASTIPAGGRRYYVTVDVAPTPEAGREIQIGVPLGGIQVASGNDGPTDVALVGTAVHRISASALLATVAATPLDLTVGQTVDVTVAVRNRGATTLAGVVPHTITLVPALAFAQLTGPLPAQLTLAPGASDTLRYQFRIDTPGDCQFIAVVGLPDSSVMSEPAAGPVLDVRAVPTAVRLEPRSNLPAVVSRGQENTTPLIWRLSHADQDVSAGRIVVHALQLQVETAAGALQAASAVFDQLEIRSGGVARTLVTAVPDTSVLNLQLVPPILIDAGETVDVPLTARIASNAGAASFQLRIVPGAAVTASDASGAHAVGTLGTLPWTTAVTAIHTTATQVELSVTPQLPAGVNRGQTSVPVATLHLVLPGNPGESEARAVQLTVSLQDSAAAALDPARVWSRAEVWSQASLLLAVDAPAAADGRLVLPLTIPRAFASGAPADLILRANVRPDAAAGWFAAAIAAAGDVVVQDATTGGTLAVVPVAPAAFPAPFGLSQVFDAVQEVQVTAASRVPASAPGGATLHVADVSLTHTGAAGSADVLLRSMRVRVTDPQGTLAVPRDVVAGLELREGGSVVGVAAAVPVSPNAVEITLASPRRITAGGRADFELHAVLTGAPALTAFRFALEASAFDLVDANDPSRAVAGGGTLPFATNTVQIVLPPSAVEFGIVTDPPVNVLRGQRGATVLVVHVRHPGIASESAVTLSRLIVHTRDPQGRALAAASAFDAVRLRTVTPSLHRAGLRQGPAGARGPGVQPTIQDVAAVVEADSLTFDLSAWPALESGQTLELTLEADVSAGTFVEDLRFAARAASLRVSAGSSTPAVRALAGAVLPYESPTMHLAAPDLASTFSNYPNPFAAGRQSTHVAFYLPADSRVTVDVCTLTGERVIRLLDGAARPAGMNDELVWDGRNGHGEVVRNGTYVLCIDVQGPGGGKLRRKLAVVR